MCAYADATICGVMSDNPVVNLTSIRSVEDYVEASGKFRTECTSFDIPGRDSGSAAAFYIPYCKKQRFDFGPALEEYRSQSVFTPPETGKRVSAIDFELLRVHFHDIHCPNPCKGYEKTELPSDRVKSRTRMDPTKAIITTTINGECFSIQSRGIGNGDGRDGFLHYFTIRDVRKKRGIRNVSLFVSNTDKATISNFDQLLDVAIINTFRQAFDNGAFSFEQPFSTTEFFELPLKPSAFEPSSTASDDRIRRFIEFGVYYLAYKFAERPNSYVDFSGIDDLFYLGADLQDLRRNVWLLIEDGILGKSTASTLSNPDRVTPTARLVRHVEDELLAIPTLQLVPDEVEEANIDNRKVFVVHGHANELREEVAKYLRDLGLDPIILHEQANQGQTIIEKFEKHANVGFAVVLLTPDDIGAPIAHPDQTRKRARQNVILELGYFVGKLGRKGVCPIYVEGVEYPSDFHGVLYVVYDQQGKWKQKLLAELKAAGMSANA
jgi:hypothetical protein